MKKQQREIINETIEYLEEELKEIKESKIGAGDDEYVRHIGYRDGIENAVFILRGTSKDIESVKESFGDHIRYASCVGRGEEEFYKGYVDGIERASAMLEFCENRPFENCVLSSSIAEEAFPRVIIEDEEEVSFTPATQHYNYCDASELEYLTGSLITNVRVQEGEDFEREIIIEGCKCEKGSKEEFEFLIEPLSVFKRTDVAAYKNQEEFDRANAPEGLYGEVEGFGAPSK